MKRLCILLAMFLPQAVHAQRRAVMENLWTSGPTLLVDTTTLSIDVTSSVTASAYFGDGSHLQNIGNSMGNNTWSGTATFQSSVTFNGGVFGRVFRSSATTFGIAIAINTSTLQTYTAISTLTYVTSGSSVLIHFDCPYLAAGGDNGFFGAIVDGAYIDGETAAKGFSSNGNGGDVNQTTTSTVSFDHITNAALSNASHSFAIVAAESGGSSAVLNSGSASVCAFWVRDFF